MISPYHFESLKATCHLLENVLILLEGNLSCSILENNIICLRATFHFGQQPLNGLTTASFLLYNTSRLGTTLKSHANQLFLAWEQLCNHLLKAACTSLMRSVSHPLESSLSLDRSQPLTCSSNTSCLETTSRSLEGQLLTDCRSI